MPIPLIPDITVFQRKLSGFPLETYQAGESVLIARLDDRSAADP